MTTNTQAKKTKMIKVNPARHIVVTTLARASFPQLFTPRSFQDQPDQAKEFKIDLLLDKDDIKKPGKGAKGATPSLYEAYCNARSDQWGSNKEKWPKMRYGFKDVFKDGNKSKNSEGEVYTGYAGKIVITAKAKEKYPPKIVDRYGKPLEEKDMYGGCFVFAQLVARPYDFAGNRGVSFKLNQVMKWEDGERFGGGGNHEMAFAVEEDGSGHMGGGEAGEGGGESEDDNW